MIAVLPEAEVDWLARFFSAPNGLAWADIRDGAAPQALADQIAPWLDLLSEGRSGSPIVLPFVRQNSITGWYATSSAPQAGSGDIGSDLQAWLGPTYLERFDRLVDPNDPMARILRTRFEAPIYRFTGADPQANHAISVRLSEIAQLLKRRPRIAPRGIRPVGVIRSDFERALLAQDEVQAQASITELRGTGRLNEENLRYLDVRLKAGLGDWRHIARDHWLVSTLSDLALPPQILSDLIEALYRTYVEDIDAQGDASATLEAFDRHVASRYPRLFATRRGVRSPRVVKAFLLFEQLQARPSQAIAAQLASLLPEEERGGAPEGAVTAIEAQPAAATTEADADEALDDGQFDRAFELLLALPPTRKSISRALTCALSIGGPDASRRLLAFIDAAEASVRQTLSPSVVDRIAEVRDRVMASAATPDGWIAWAAALKEGRNLAGAEAAVRDLSNTWDVLTFQTDEGLCAEFADLLGNLQGDAAAVLRRAFSHVFAAFFPDGSKPLRATKPIAAMLLLLLALEESLSSVDLTLLAQLLGHLLALGPSEAEYLSLVCDLGETQGRVASYAHLPWSLDLAEAFAVAPCPSDAGRNARLSLFLQILDQTQAFAHRLQPQDLEVLAFLAKDYGVDDSALLSLRRSASENAKASQGPTLQGKTIGIYTLATSAGARAKEILEGMFPGCRVEVNSDLVCTAKLGSLAKAADLFVFAWKSSSHQAFYCVKEAITKGEPIWAAGKGTASILRAVLEGAR